METPEYAHFDIPQIKSDMFWIWKPDVDGKFMAYLRTGVVDVSLIDMFKIVDMVDGVNLPPSVDHTRLKEFFISASKFMFVVALVSSISLNNINTENISQEVGNLIVTIGRDNKSFEKPMMELLLAYTEVIARKMKSSDKT